MIHRALVLSFFFLFMIRFTADAETVVTQMPVSGGGISRWSQLWQDPGPNGNDLDLDAKCWEDFTLAADTVIDHVEWWGTGACELGFRIEFWPQDPNTIAYQPLAVREVNNGPIKPTARFTVVPADYTTTTDNGGLFHFSLDLATPVSLTATNVANPRWFIGIIGLTQAYTTFNWSQGLGGSTRTYQWLRGDANNFRVVGEGRAMLIGGVVPEPTTATMLSVAGTLLLARRRR